MIGAGDGVTGGRGVHVARRAHNKLHSSVLHGLARGALEWERHVARCEP